MILFIEASSTLKSIYITLFHQLNQNMQKSTLINITQQKRKKRRRKTRNSHRGNECH